MSYYSRLKLYPHIRHRIYSNITSTSIMVSHQSSMSTRLHSVPYIHYRSGTSKGPYFLFSDLPENAKERDDIIINTMGAGHPQQIRGIGGGTGISSKACIVGRSDPNDSEADIRYMFR
jgi:2-methylaconitate cis-trans-isomerase PrpF